MRTFVLLITLFALATAARAQDNLATERAILIELFKSSGGPRWERNRNWNSEVSICFWEGVSCTYIDYDEKRPSVGRLDLDFNNLKGTLPATLAQLTHLEGLDLAGNDLEGDVPQGVLDKWDRHQLEFSWTGNRFNNLLTKVVVEQSPTGVECTGTQDVFYRFEVTGLNAKMQSVHCPNGRDTVCTVREGTVFGVDRLSRAFSVLNVKDSKPADYDYPFSAATHGVFLTTTWVWGDGSTTSIKTYNRQGPLSAWTAQQLSLALLADADWGKASTKPKCDFER